MARRARAARARARRAGLDDGRARCRATIDAAALRDDPPGAARRTARQHRRARPTTATRYVGARGIRFYLHPGSGLAKKAPKWVLAAELTETSRLYARCAAQIEPEWIEEVAGDRVTRDYFEPHWDDDARRGRRERARAALRAHAGRAAARVASARIDPRAARDVFIREALVPGDAGDRRRHSSRTTARSIAEVAELEHKARRQDVLVDDEAIAAFYAERVPARHPFARDVRALARATPSARDPRVLFLTRDDADAARGGAGHRGAVSRDARDGRRRRCRSSIASRPAIRSTA